MIDWTTVKPYFETDAIAHLATLMMDGSPHSVPLWVGVEGERLALFTETDTLKDRNLRHDPRVAVSVTAADNPYSMAFVRGTAEKGSGTLRVRMNPGQPLSPLALMLSPQKPAEKLAQAGITATYEP